MFTIELHYNQLEHLFDLVKKERLEHFRALPVRRGASIKETQEIFDKYWKGMEVDGTPIWPEQIIGTLYRLLEDKIDEINREAKEALKVIP